MSASSKLELEVLGGPLDGAKIVLEQNADWAKVGKGSLIFPWDDELGTPQATFIAHEQGWRLQARKSPHGLRRLNRDERLEEGELILAQNDILIASQTWLLVYRLE